MESSWSIDIAVIAEAACKIVDLCEYNTPFGLPVVPEV